LLIRGTGTGGEQPFTSFIETKKTFNKIEFIHYTFIETKAHSSKFKIL